MWVPIWKVGPIEDPGCFGQVVALEDGTRVLIVVDKEKGTVRTVVGATCPHVGASLLSGVLHNDRIVCPWHGACFNVYTGDIEEGPSISGIPIYTHRINDGQVEIEVDEATKAPIVAPRRKPDPEATLASATVVIIGGGAGGHAAISTLIEQGFPGTITLISSEEALPYDRPSLSKAMDKPLDSILLSPDTFYSGRVTLMLGCTALAVNPLEKSVKLDNGESVHYDKLIVATGAAPYKLRIPGAELRHIYTLRSVADANAIAARAETSKNIVIIGAGFIGLEVAAYFQRNCEAESITILNRDPAPPLKNVYGPMIGACIQGIHESNGIKFVFECDISQILPGADHSEVGQVVTNKGIFNADLIVVGIGVALNTSLLKGVVELTERVNEVQVNHFMQTTNTDIYAVGDIARFPLWASTGKSRSEHWAVAQNHGRTAARHILGQLKPFKTIPFFWTFQFGMSIRFAGYTTIYDRVIIDGNLAERTFLAFFIEKGRVAAVASLGRDPHVAAAIELFRHDKMPTVAQLDEGPGSFDLQKQLAMLTSVAH